MELPVTSSGQVLGWVADVCDRYLIPDDILCIENNV